MIKLDGRFSIGHSSVELTASANEANREHLRPSVQLRKTPAFSATRVATGALFLTIAASASSAFSQEADLAKKLSNPVAAMISVPFQFNYDGNIGSGDKGGRTTLNLQPVVPIHLNSEWNLISRTILPTISASRKARLAFSIRCRRSAT